MPQHATKSRVTHIKAQKVKSQQKKRLRRPRKIKRRNLRRRVSGATNIKIIKVAKKTNKTVEKRKKKQQVNKRKHSRYNRAIEHWLLEVISSDPDSRAVSTRKQRKTTRD